MKRGKDSVWAVVISAALITAGLVLSCGEDDIITGTIVLEIEGEPDITFTGAADGVLAFYTAEGSGPIPPLSTAVVAMDDSDPDLAISFRGKKAGTYTIDDDDAYFSCSDASGNVYAAMESIENTSGEVVVTEMGAVGESIVGSYSFTANAYNGGGPTSNTVAISGTFDVIRVSDR